MECKIIATEMDRCADGVRLPELHRPSKQKWGWGDHRRFNHF